MIKIRQESAAKRCEICHQADLFDAEQNYCQRCANLPVTRESAAVVESNNKNIHTARRQWRIDNRANLVSIGSRAGGIGGGIGSALFTLFYILINIHFDGGPIRLIIAVISALSLTVPGLIFGALVGAIVGLVMKYSQIYNQRVNLTLIGASIGCAFGVTIFLLLNTFLTLQTGWQQFWFLLVTLIVVVAGGVAGNKVDRAIL